MLQSPKDIVIHKTPVRSLSIALVHVDALTRVTRIAGKSKCTEIVKRECEKSISTSLPGSAFFRVFGVLTKSLLRSPSPEIFGFNVSLKESS